MTYMPTEKGFMQLEDSEKQLRLIFPNYTNLEPRHSLSGTDWTGLRRSEQLAMFRISAETCRRFTLAEVLMMAAMNFAPALIATEKKRTNNLSQPRATETGRI